MENLKESNINPNSTMPCRTVAFSYDSSYLAEVNYLGFITIRSTKTGEIVNRFMGQTTLSETVRFEPNTNILFVVGAGYEGYKDFGCVKGFEIPSGRRILELNGHTDDIVDLCFLNSEERKVVTVGLDGKAIVHNLTDHTQWCWDEYGEYLNTCRERPNFRNHFAVAGDSDYTYVLDADGKNIVAELFTPNDSNGLIWSPDGRYLLVGGDNLDIQYFDSENDWNKVHQVHLGGSVKKTCYDPKSDTHGLAACYDGQVWAFPLFPQEKNEISVVVKNQFGIWGTNVAASKDFLAVPSFGDRAFLFLRDEDGFAKSVIGDTPKPTYGCNWISISKTSSLLVTSHDDGKLRFRDLDNGDFIKEISPPTTSLLMGASFHPTLPFLGVIDFSGKVFIINHETDIVLDTIQMSFGPGITLDFNSGGNFLAVGGYGPDGWVLSIDQNGRIIDSVVLDHPNTGVVKNIQFLSNNRIIIGSGDGSIVYYQFSNGSWLVQRHIETNMELCNAVTYSQKRDIVYTGGRDQTVRAISLAEGRELMHGVCHTRSIKSIQISECENYVATGSYDRSIILWSTDSLLAILPPLRIANSGFPSIKLYDGKIYACSFDGYVCCWDMEGNILWVKNSTNHKNRD